MRFPSDAPFLVGISVLSIASMAVASCVDGKLTPAAAVAIEAGADAACTALLPLASPYLPAGFGTFDVLVCKGADAALGAALAPVTATSAIAPASGGSGPPAPIPRCAIRVVSTQRLLGFAPCEARLTSGHYVSAVR